MADSQLEESLKCLSNLYQNLSKELEENQLALRNLEDQIQKANEKKFGIMVELQSNERKRVLFEQEMKSMDEERRKLENDILCSTSKLEWYENKNASVKELVEKEKRRFSEVKKALKDRVMTSLENEEIANLINKLDDLKERVKIKREEKANLYLELESKSNYEADKKDVESGSEDEMKKQSIADEIAQLERQVSEKREAVSKVEKENLVLRKRNNAQLLRLQCQVSRN